MTKTFQKLYEQWPYKNTLENVQMCMEIKSQLAHEAVDELNARKEKQQQMQHGKRKETSYSDDILKYYLASGGI